MIDEIPLECRKSKSTSGGDEFTDRVFRRFPSHRMPFSAEWRTIVAIAASVTEEKSVRMGEASFARSSGVSQT